MAAFLFLYLAKWNKEFWLFAASMKWTMTDNKKAVADISGTEPVARGIQ